MYEAGCLIRIITAPVNVSQSDVVLSPPTFQAARIQPSLPGTFMILAGNNITLRNLVFTKTLVEGRFSMEIEGRDVVLESVVFEGFSTSPVDVRPGASVTMRDCIFADGLSSSGPTGRRYCSDLRLIDFKAWQ